MYDCVDVDGHPVPIVASPPEDRTARPAIVCPWLADLPEPDGLWLSIMPIHDVNAYLTSPLGVPDPRHDLYWGIFGLDPSRSQEMLLRLAEARGIRGIVNLPTMAFFDGRTRQSFERLGYTKEAEADFLAKARSSGFRTAMATPARNQQDHRIEKIVFDVLA